MHQVLEEFGNIQNDNKVAYDIVIDVNLQDAMEQNKLLCNENARLKKNIKKMRIKEDNLVENHEIEKMIVETLEECLKS